VRYDYEVNFPRFLPLASLPHLPELFEHYERWVIRRREVKSGEWDEDTVLNYNVEVL
jgi:hypothetical protein